MLKKDLCFMMLLLQELCDEQTPLDMYSLFDTSLLFSEFTTDPTGTVIQDTSLFTVEYTYVDDTGATVTLDPTLPLSFNSGDQTITVTLTNNSTNSALTAGVSTVELLSLKSMSNLSLTLLILALLEYILLKNVMIWLQDADELIW